MRPEIILAALAVALPTITALVGIVLSRGDYSKLDSRLGSLEGRLDGRISSLESKLDGRISSLESKLDGRINSVKTELDARITGLENRLHADMMQVIGKLTELEVRATRLEEKQNR